MAELLVLKIKYGSTLRRITIPKTPEPSFTALDKKIRVLFQLTDEAPLAVTYVDNEGDVVTMADDQDLKDAVVLQGLNPLRLDVKLEGSVTASPATSVISVTSDTASDASRVQTTIERNAKINESHAKVVPVESKTSQPLEDPVKMEEEARSAWKAAAAQAEADAKKIQEEICCSLKAAWENARENGALKGDITSVIAAFEPLLKVAPGKLAEVVEAAMKSGFSASFSPSFCSVETYQEPETPSKESVPEQEERQPAVGDAAGSSQVTGSGSLAEPEFQTPAEEKTASKGAASATASLSAVGESSADRIFHTGVQCDVCGMIPIMGPRYKSTVKMDYDLCRNCYTQHGVEGEYNKIDRPVFRPRHHPFWAHAGHPQGRMGVRGACPAYGPAGPGPCFGGRPFHMGRGSGCGRSFDKFPDGKLDARFVKDVTIFDGTELAPGTPFTKIWRLRNNGTIPWPQHTRLVHVGGDHCGADDFVAVHVPEEGLQAEEEVEVSVDLVAPEKPGRYVSHWRLMAPGGRKFGHRVWSLIQVVPQDEPSPQLAESVADTAADSDEQIASDVASAPPVPVEGPVHDTPDLIDLSGPEPAAPVPEAVQEVNAPVVELDVEVNEASAMAEVIPPIASSAIAATRPESPKVEDTSVGGFSLVEHPMPGEASLAVPSSDRTPPASDEMEESIEVQAEDAEEVTASAFVDVPVYMAGEEPVVVEVEVSAEEAEMASLLNQLEAMGFTDRELNADLLKEHSFDLQDTLDELVAVSEWDPMLEELHEMGFYDDAMNRRLMRKNKGSVKRVVKDLVQMYREQGQEMAAQ